MPGLATQSGQLILEHPLVKLVQKKNFVGWCYSIDYDAALVMTNDLWKAEARGIPHNSFLVATAFDPEKFDQTSPDDQEVLLFRVTGSANLPQYDDLVRTKIDTFQQYRNPHDVERDYDEITLNKMQFHGLECRVIGTFYTIGAGGELRLGSDLESFASATRLNVYRPRGKALETIVNYVDPIRKRAARDEAEALGIKKPVAPFKIGSVRYTSSDRMHRGDAEADVPVFVQPSDFLARRTAVLGMTRTGKSNMIKQLVSVVKRVADESGVKIGQLVYDINGEYANANQQDKGALADIYPSREVIRYRMLDTEGFEVLQNNFYTQLSEGFATIRRVLREKSSSSAGDVDVFLNTSLEEPDPKEEPGEHRRWKVRSAAYQALLHRADFPSPDNHKVSFEANATVRQQVEAAAKAGRLIGSQDSLKDPKYGLTLGESMTWFLAARLANRQSTLTSSSGKAWLDEDTKAMLNMLAKSNDGGTFIKGYSILTDARPYHSPRRTQEVGDEIYNHLANGRIVLLDLSVGDPELREKLSTQIASDVFNKSMYRFVQGEHPPNIVVYVEEAHNLIGKSADLTQTWPRLAKEGAKYRIAMVYATQEVSSVHPNILANTENWFVSHLNNDREVRELAHFYDFADFSRSLVRAQDVGFARVKTLSGPFVVPTQIDKFDPEAEKNRIAKLHIDQGIQPSEGGDGQSGSGSDGPSVELFS